MNTWACFLAGEWVDGNNFITVTDKYTGEKHALVHAADQSLLELAVKKAKENFYKYRNLPSYVKYEECLFIAQEVQKKKQELAKNIAIESGKPLKYALAEAERAVQVFTIAAEEAKRLPKEYLSMDWTPNGKNREGLVKWFPAGVVAGISPFNFPLNLAVHKIAPAFASGCPIILKPSSLTPTSVLMLAEIVNQTQNLRHLLFILPTDRLTGNELVRHPDISVLSFTGSPEVGWKMKEMAGKKKVILELGGNAAVVIDKNTDIDKHLASFIYGAFAYSGQICIHAQRFIVHEACYDEFKLKISEQTKKLKTGSPLDETSDISVMIDEQNADRVEDWINEAVGKKAVVCCGNKREKNILYPTIVENVPVDCKIYAEETFGPVITIESFENKEEAVQKVNNSRFGLQCGIYTESIEFMKYCFENIEVGGIIHNQVPTLRFDHMPYGGIKDSGIGREGVAYAIRDYMEPKILVW
jgi:glyceraldehyde-3-phosphate dehydrogenase (NADP+)